MRQMGWWTSGKHVFAMETVWRELQVDLCSAPSSRYWDSPKFPRVSLANT